MCYPVDRRTRKKNSFFECSYRWVDRIDDSIEADDLQSLADWDAEQLKRRLALLRGEGNKDMLSRCHADRSHASRLAEDQRSAGANGKSQRRLQVRHRLNSTTRPTREASPERHTTHMRALQTQQNSPPPGGRRVKNQTTKLTTPSPSETGPSPSAASTAPTSSGRGRAAPPASSGTAPAERRRAST